MATPPSKVIADILATESLGVFGAASGWGIYVSKSPANPDTTITVYDTGGFQSDLLMDGDRLNFPTIMMHVRANDYQTVWSKAKVPAI